MTSRRRTDMSDAPVVTTVDAVVERYIKLRDRKKEMKSEFDKKVEVIDTALERCEAFLLNLLNSQGAESIRTSFGTAYVSLKTSASVSDREAFLGYVREHNEWSMLDVRANKTVIDEYRREKEDLPPGVNWSAIRSVNIRRS